MQALLRRSMIENKNTPHGSIETLFRTTIFLLLMLSGSCVFVVAQSTAIQPCTESSAAKTKPRSPVVNTSVTQTAVGENIPADEAVTKILSPYSVKVRELENVIGKLDGELKKTPIGAGSLGNFVTDGLRAQASRKVGRYVPVVITNGGGLRKNVIAAGDLRAADVFELLPFENALVELDLTGQQLRNLLEAVLKGRDAQSGARIRYRVNADNTPEAVSIRLVSPHGDEVDINPNATYRIVTIDYLVNLSSGSLSILKEGKNLTPIGVTMRDAMMEFVKSETAAGRTIKSTIDDRFVLVEQS